MARIINLSRNVFASKVKIYSRARARIWSIEIRCVSDLGVPFESEGRRTSTR